jgi:hypothetical protein
MDTRKKRRRSSVFDDTRTKGGAGGEGGSYGVDLDAETKGGERGAGAVCIAACNGARGGDDSNCHVQ